jgi:hypothetical protein
MILKLNDDLIDFFSDIQIKFEWNDKFCIEFMNYFPLLKKGLTTKNTYYKVIVIYGLINNFIDLGDLFNDIFSDIIIKTDLIIKIYNSYIKSSLYKNFSEELLLKILHNDSLFKITENENDNISNELELELAKSLLDTIILYSSENSSNCLFKLIDTCYPKSMYNKTLDRYSLFSPQSSKIFDVVLKTTSMRLFSNILSNNTEDMITAFYIDEVDYYIGYLDLYQLAISRKNIKIADILKEMIIIKNLHIKQALIISFEDLIGQSDIPDIIYDIVIK